MARSLAPLAVFLALIAPVSLAAQEAVGAGASECVVLLHGLGRSETSFVVMEEMLGAAGYRVVNLGYPSTETTIEGLLGYVTGAVETCGG